ncbi:MAG: bifunctional diaminohydroxyphosphoribosylaminopyrimidine deaminase/5-amino-6-(5-phosphoribosylamino)uracil reductase RibD [Candidatus Eisenbacteria bacterium]|nr:bifunctional diaminohydroxyphosphoribosylaminopyrimidine deaminase/5-amino-6-(5-phosphoribosylamino)uracil reductase RibD [Candidatus Eisenbacteria bacterium]
MSGRTRDRTEAEPVPAFRDHAEQADARPGSRAGADRGGEAEDARYMSEALSLGERGRGSVSPNPLVGAVVIRDGNVVGRGWHARYGAAHAEVVALAEAGELARGATLYVTLEPCCVWGNTPPCTDAIVDADVREVVFALKDPNPDVCGRGLATLRRAGVAVRQGVLAEEAARANAGYLRSREVGLPSVLLKLALSLDGRVAPPPGGPRWTSSEASRALAHRMRGEADSVMVGVETVLSDDPLLTDRRPGAGAKQAARVILDTSLRTPLESRVVSTASEARTIIACGDRADEERESELRALGVDVWRFGATERGVDLDAVLRKLAAKGRLYVLAEGGPAVATELLREGLADRIAFFVCPVLYGASGGATLGQLPAELSTRRGLRAVRWREIGGDLLLEAEIDVGK